MADDKPIIVVKKKGHHGGHHGGAWKVAYADFVTAMMAFFMVMWLVNTAEQPTKQAIATYFRRPGIFEAGSGTPLLIGGGGILEEGLPPDKAQTGRKALGNTNVAAPHNAPTPSGEARDPYLMQGNSAAEVPYIESEEFFKEKLEYIARGFREKLGLARELQKILGEVDISVEPDGIRIEIMDTEKASMFALGSARIMPEAEPAFAEIAKAIREVSFPVEILGHTDGKPFSTQYKSYSNWELSSDRANAARRLLEREGITPERITSVRGMADRELKVPADPFAAANRRITLKLKIPPPTGPEQPMDLLGEAPPANVRNSDDELSDVTGRLKGIDSSNVRINDPDPGAANVQRGRARGTPSPSAEKDKIFGDNPVIGPVTPFGDFDF